jgi:hypothetical protein
VDKSLCGKKGIILSSSEDIGHASIPNPNLNSNIQRQLLERQKILEIERINAEKALRLNS